VIRCLFVSDLHGRVDRDRTLFQVIEERCPIGVFLGGDLLPPWAAPQSLGDGAPADFVNDFLARNFESLKDRLGRNYPEIFVILGNDDPRCEESALLDGTGRGLWNYAHQRRLPFRGHEVMGYAFVPPTPYPLKDWERYDVSRYVDPGSSSPEEGRRTVRVADREIRYGTIGDDLAKLVGSDSVERTICLFHSPPYETLLDRAPLDGIRVDHVPLDVHVGSIAIRRFIEVRQPLLSLHGHVHEAARLTGTWRDRLGRTIMLNAAHDGPELSLISFDLEDLQHATRELL